MKYKSKLFGLYLPIFALISVATVVMRSIALFLDFNSKTGYFTNKTLISVADYLVVAAVIFFITYIFTARRDLALIPDFTSPATYVPTGLAGVSIAFLSVELLTRVPNLYNGKSQILLVIIIIATALLGALSIVHFALTALVEAHSSTRRANYGICTVLFLSFYVIYLYFSSEILFESHLPINAPNKIVDQMAYLFAAVFFLYETRLSLGREKWRAYIAFGFIGATVCAYSSIPSIIIYMARGEVVSNSIYESALTFSLFIFILARLLLTGNLIEDSESSTVSAIIAGADARELELNPVVETPDVVDISGEALETPDDNQITIDDLSEEAAPEDNSEEESAELTENTLPDFIEEPMPTVAEEEIPTVAENEAIHEASATEEAISSEEQEASETEKTE